MSQRKWHLWTDEETAMLKIAAKQYGQDWIKIKKTYFKDMDEEVIKNKFYKLRLHSDAGETQNDKEKKTRKQLEEISAALF